MDDQESISTSVMSIVVTEEQRQFIIDMWNMNNWQLTLNSESMDQDQHDTSDQSPLIQPCETDPECAHCLCKPCVTSESNRQLWWETENSDPANANSALRKPIYKRFWTMMYHRGVWVDPRYLLRKDAALADDPSMHAWSGPRRNGHPRDLMPKCVTSMVRMWLPNPHSKPYMGHKWS